MRLKWLRNFHRNLWVKEHAGHIVRAMEGPWAAAIGKRGAIKFQRPPLP